MPELPEVETIRRDLEKKILHKRISVVNILETKTVRGKAPLFLSVLKNNSFIKIDRIGKLMIFKLEKNNLAMLSHLKMTGQLIYEDKNKIIIGGHDEKKKIIPQNPHTRVIIIFKDKSRLYFNDMRKFGYLEIVNQKQLENIIAKYGIEPGLKNFTLKNLIDVFRNKKTSVKAVLLDQNLIAGIGNIYADEILFSAGVKPDRLGFELTQKEIKKIHEASLCIIKKAIKYRGTTFNNYVDSEGKQGGFYKLLKIYDRKGEKCYRCKSIIEKTRIAGRGTYYCPKCQK